MKLSNLQHQYDMKTPDSVDPIDSFYEEEMKHHANIVTEMVEEYTELSSKRAALYAKCIAYCFLDGLDEAKQIFDSFNLTYIHAYAMCNYKNDFIQEMDKMLEDYEQSQYY